MDYFSLKSLLRRHWVISNLYPTPYPILDPRTSRIPPQSSMLTLATDDGGWWCLVPFSQLERENNYMISVMQSTMLDFAVVTPFCTSFSSEISWGTVALFTSCSTPLVLPRLGLLSGRKSTAKIAHAMRDAREGHSVTYLQSKEVPAGIHVRRQGARLGATGTSKSLSLRCELRSCRRCSEIDSPRSPRISTGEGDLDTARPCIRLCAVGKMLFSRPHFFASAPSYRGQPGASHAGLRSPGEPLWA